MLLSLACCGTRMRLGRMRSAPGSTAASVAQKHAVVWVISWPCMVSARQTEGSNIGNSDDVISDEVLVLSSEALADALQTRLGGRSSKAKAEELAAEGSCKFHHDDSLAAAQACHDMLGGSAASKDSTVGPKRSRHSLGERETAARRKLGLRSGALRASTWSSRVHHRNSCGHPCGGRRASGAQEWRTRSSGASGRSFASWASRGLSKTERKKERQREREEIDMETREKHMRGKKEKRIE